MAIDSRSPAETPTRQSGPGADTAEVKQQLNSLELMINLTAALGLTQRSVAESNQPTSTAITIDNLSNKASVPVDIRTQDNQEAQRLSATISNAFGKSSIPGEVLNVAQANFERNGENNGSFVLASSFDLAGSAKSFETGAPTRVTIQEAALAADKKTLTVTDGVCLVGKDSSLCVGAVSDGSGNILGKFVERAGGTNESVNEIHSIRNYYDRDGKPTKSVLTNMSVDFGLARATGKIDSKLPGDKACRFEDAVNSVKKMLTGGSKSYDCTD